MDIDLDKYARNFRIFYSKVISGHPNKSNLEAQFKALLQNQADKWRSDMFNNSTRNRAPSSFTNRARSLKANTPKKTKNSRDWQFETNVFSRAFVFANLALLLQTKNRKGLAKIKQSLQRLNVFTEKNMFQGARLRKIVFLWRKIEKLFTNSFNAKPMQVLGDDLNDLDEQFIEICFKTLTDLKTEKVEIQQITQEQIRRISSLAQVNISYFEFKKNAIKRVIKVGQFKESISIGRIIDQNIIVVDKQIPKKMKEQAQQQKNLVDLSKAADQILKMYDDNELKIFGLDAVISSNKTAASNKDMESTLHSSNRSTSRLKLKRTNSSSSSRTIA